MFCGYGEVFVRYGLRRAQLARALVALAVGSSGCGGEGPTEPDQAPEPVYLEAHETVRLEVNDFQVSVDRRGQIVEGEWAGECPVIFRAGLWVGAYQVGAPRGNIVWVGTTPSSNYTTRQQTVHVGVYQVPREALFIPNLQWPIGAPVDGAGQPVVFGDAMAWSSLVSDPSLDLLVLSDPLRDLRVSQAVFGFARPDLRNVLFVRHSVENSGTEDLGEVYTGFYSDTDLDFASGNATAFDPELGLSITYATPRDDGTQYVSGHAYVSWPAGSGSHCGVTSNRVMRKNIHELYGEENLTSARQVLYALRGWTNLGQPMADPESGQETSYALTGDPVSGTGWVDHRADVRSLISSGPFRLGPGESRELTLVWTVVKAGTLAEGLQRLRATVSAVREEPGLWGGL